MTVKLIARRVDPQDEETLLSHIDTIETDDEWSVVYDSEYEQLLELMRGKTSKGKYGWDGFLVGRDIEDNNSIIVIPDDCIASIIW